VPINLKDHLKMLCESHGPSGYETPVRDALAEVWRPLADSLEVGALGSLVALKRGTQPEADPTRRRKIMLCGHIDEIGMLVTHIEGPFLRARSLNGLDVRNATGKPVLVHTSDGSIQGVLGLRPLHISPEHATRYPTFEEAVIDLALPAEEIARRVRVGDVITMDLPMYDLQNGRVAAKAVDDRASVAAITACLDLLQGRRHLWDVLAVATVQEEVGSHGARAAAYRWRPDVAIALDVCFAPQPGITDGAHKMGEGPPLSLGANFHPALYEAIGAAAGRIELTLAPDPTPMASGTDAWPVQISRDGIPTGLLNIPIRNMHSTVETVEIKDIERAGRVLAEFITGLEADFLTTIVWDKEKDKESNKNGQKEAAR
jgi:endoglucanase